MRANQYFPLAQVRSLYLDDKLSLRQIAKQLGYVPSTVQRWLHYAGVELRSTGGRNNLWGVKGRPK